MAIEELEMAYATVAGRLQGTISGIIKYSDDEISSRVKKTLEEALKFAEEELASVKKDSTL